MIYVFAFFSPEFSWELYVSPGLQKIKQLTNISPTSDEDTLPYTH